MASDLSFPQNVVKLHKIFINKNIANKQSQWEITLSLDCPCRAIASYLIFPSGSTCMASAFDIFFFRPISRGYWATWISGKAPPSPKSSNKRGIQPFRYPYGGGSLREETKEVCRDLWDLALSSASSWSWDSWVGAGKKLQGIRIKYQVQNLKQNTFITIFLCTVNKFFNDL